MRATMAKTAYQWADATERLKSIRGKIDRLEVQLHAEEWLVSKTKGQLARLERDRSKVCTGLVKRA